MEPQQCGVEFGGASASGTPIEHATTGQLDEDINVDFPNFTSVCLLA